jgi:nucleoid-associated protein YgaU
MKTVVVLLGFAAAFGLAGLWQSQRLARLERERELAIRVQEGELGDTPSGLLEAGAGVVVIGKRSGAEPIGRASEPQPETPQTEPQAQPQSTPPVEPPAPPRVEPTQPLADFELAVQPGQTLSSIVREHYGTDSQSVVRALAAYNGLGDGNALKTGQKLKLPSASALGK